MSAGEVVLLADFMGAFFGNCVGEMVWMRIS
jgi:hypothetical protein